MTTEEVNDFYVYRDQKSGQNVIRAHIRHKAIEKNVLNYCLDNDSEVRIPSLLFLGSHPDTEQNNIKNFFLNSCRKQIGCHSFIKSKGELCCAVCYLNLKNVYSMSDEHPISSVYPCFRNTGGPLVMGILFARSFTFGSGHRTFGRQFAAVQQGSGAVFDVEEDIIHGYKRYDQTGVYGLKVCDLNQPMTPFPDWHQEIVFAIYVCRGARLVVCDDRCYWSNPQLLKKTPESERKMDRSLFQESSLVIYEGCTLLTLPFEDSSCPDDAPGPFSIDFRKAATLFRPQNRFLQSILSGQNKFVIFLGSNNSQYNSIGWQLMIRTNHSSPKQINGKVEGFLLAPEGGRILDILPWNEGFEQIYWRHRYQRLFRSVLNPEPTLGRLGFGIPPEYIMKRILGLTGEDMYVEIPDSLCRPPPNYLIAPPEDCDIRKYLGPVLERSVKRDTWAQLNSMLIYPPPAPALYPPIWEKHSNKLKYIPYGTQIKFYSTAKVDGREYTTVKIDKHIYALMKKRTDDYVWEPNTIRPSFADSNVLSPYDFRLGSDYLIYHKTNIKIGILGHYYFEGPFAEKHEPVPPPDPKAKEKQHKQELPAQGKHTSPKKPNDGPKEQAKQPSPAKGTAGKPVAAQKAKTNQKDSPDQKPVTPPQQTQHQKHEKKKRQPKNNTDNKK